MYVRPTIFVEEGPFSAKATDMTVGMYVVAFPVARPQQRPAVVRCMISSWARASDLSGMPRAKSGAIYANMRLPRIEAAERGFDDALLLNANGTVAEATGACLFIVRDGRLCTPQVTDSILEGVTRNTVLGIARDLGHPVQERAIDRTELYVADEVFSAGTLSEISAIPSVDDVVVGDGRAGEITVALVNAYDKLIFDRSSSLVQVIHPA
jgi:branched-chain amino acid aminotransferase